jgi:hypothetical protein
MAMRSQNPITVVPLGSKDQLWRDFLSRSANGTLFHDLEFLRYHPRDRFCFHHLVFLRNGEPIALLPGGLAKSGDGLIFCSPLGASIGGFAVTDLRADMALAMVDALQNYARQQLWSAIQITLPPSYYSFETAGLVSFALFCKRFHLEHRWLSPTLELRSEPNRFEQLYRSTQVSLVRAARRKGMRVVETGIEGWADFVAPFRDTYARHGVPATHTEDEIRDLLTRLPDRVRIHTALLDDVPVASLLVFKLTKSVAMSFYICSSATHTKESGAAFVIADAMDRLAAIGYRHLDLGPAASDMNFNAGLTFFKEGLGAVGHCRDRWFWRVEP